MDNSKPNLPQSGSEPQPEPPAESQPIPETKTKPDLNEWINRTSDRVKLSYKDGKDYYRRSPRLQKVIYQGKFFPAFWTVACIFSLMINLILIALLVSFGHYFFQLKAIVSDGLVTKASNSLAMMDQAHIVTTIPVEKTIQLQDNLPVVFDIPIDQSTQLTLAEDTRIKGAYIYLNNTSVTTDLTLPANTVLHANFDMTIPVSTSVPVDITVPINIQIPVDIAVDQTDLHQSIAGLQGAIEPYKAVLGSAFNSPKEFLICNYWWSGWLCGILFGRQ
jgi:hypothetical protein